MKPFNLEAAKAGAPVQQRCGRPARIVDFALKNEEYPLAVIYTDSYGDEQVTAASASGGYYSDRNDDGRDLMMTTVKKEGWMNIYSHDGGVFASMRGGPIFATKELADENTNDNRIACMRVEWEE